MSAENECVKKVQLNILCIAEQEKCINFFFDLWLRTQKVGLNPELSYSLHFVFSEFIKYFYLNDTQFFIVDL